MQARHTHGIGASEREGEVPRYAPSTMVSFSTPFISDADGKAAAEAFASALTAEHGASFEVSHRLHGPEIELSALHPAFGGVPVTVTDKLDYAVERGREAVRRRVAELRARYAAR